MRNVRGYEHVNGSHYTTDSCAEPVTNSITMSLSYTTLHGLLGHGHYPCQRSFPMRQILK